MEYPSLKKQFKINEKIYIMQPMKLSMIHDIEQGIATQYDVIFGCTNIPKEVAAFMGAEELLKIYNDIVSLYTKNKAHQKQDRGAIDLVAFLMTKGHLDAQNYRIDFVAKIIENYKNGK